MESNDVFEQCAAFTCVQEGGYTCRSDDAGNWSEGAVGRGNLIGSNRGISAPTLIVWSALADDASRQIEAMRDLDDATFRAISRARYWRGLGCDGVPPPIALMLFDFGFNAGVSRAGRLLQQLIAMPASDIDGDVGPKTQQWTTVPHWATISAQLSHDVTIRLQRASGVPEDGVLGFRTIAALERHPDLWPGALACAIATRQRDTYAGMRQFDVFGAGWLARTARRLDAALKLAPAF